LEFHLPSCPPYQTRNIGDKNTYCITVSIIWLSKVIATKIAIRRMTHIRLVGNNATDRSPAGQQ